MSGLMTNKEEEIFTQEIKILDQLGKLIRRPTHHFKVTGDQIIVNFRNEPSEEVYGVLRENGFNPCDAHRRKFTKSIRSDKGGSK